MKEYEPYILGKITKFEAGVIYKAMKENKLEVLPETIKLLYDEASCTFGYYSERYSQDRLYYDCIYSATKYILEENYKDAQKKMKLWEQNMIDLSTQKSSFFKYRKI